MKWIGQHIWDFISRFRSDVYLEAVESGTIASGGNLGLDSNNKIVKADTEAGELAFSGSTTNGVLTYGGAAQIDVESDLYYSGSALTMTSSISERPKILMVNTNSNAEAPMLHFMKISPGTANDEIGEILFDSLDATGGAHTFADFKAYISDATGGAEGGKLEFRVATHDGEMQPGLIIQDGNAEDEIDVTIGNGTSSVTTIAGDISITTGLVLDSVDVTTIQTSSESFANNNTSLMTSAAIQDEVLASAPAVTLAGSLDYLTISGQEITRNAIDLAADVTGVLPSANLDTDTAHLSGDQTFTGKKQIDKRSFSKTSTTHWEYQGDVLYFGNGSTTQGQLCYLKEDGSWGTADADGAATGVDADRDAMGMLAIALGDDPDVDGMLVRGVITMDYDLGDCGNPIYVSTTAGDMTSTAPSASGDFVRVLGYCLDDNNGQIWFNPDSAWVEIA